MNKNMIALAAAALVTAPAIAAEFQPAPGTKFEVNVEVGAYYLNQKNSSGVATKEFTGKGINQVEIKATHAIDSDISIFGEIEIDYDPIKDNDQIQTDDTRVGLSSKKLGRFTAGQFDSYAEDNVMEILGVGHGEKGFTSEPGKDQNDGRHLQYLKSFGDFTLAVDVMHSTDSNKTKANLGNALTLAYKLGDLTLAVGTVKMAGYKVDGTSTSLQTGTNGAVKNVTGLSARYTLGAATLLGLVASEKRQNAEDNKYAGVGMTYKMGLFDLGLAAQQVTLGRSGTTASTKHNEFVAGVGYTPFKNMTFYVDTFKLDKASKKDDGYEVGLKYAF